MGVTTFELDCAITRDGIVVISHDPELNPDHTRDAQGRFLAQAGPLIFGLDYAQLAQYDVGRLRPGSAYANSHPSQEPLDGERIPRLAELFALVTALGDRAVRFNIEMKVFPLQPAWSMAPEPFTRALLHDVARAGMAARTTIQCFDWRVLEAVHRLAPEIAIGALTDQQGDDDTVQFGRSGPSPWLGGLDARDFNGSVPRLAKASGAGTWSPNYLDLSPPQVAEAHALGLVVVPWTVNEPVEMERILAMGVDGMISDRPDLLRKILHRHGMAVPKASPDPTTAASI